MTNRRRGTCFTFKARNSLAFLKILVAENIGTDSLNCDLASEQVLVACEINLAHCAATETFFEQVTRDKQPRPGQRGLRVDLILGTDLHVVFEAQLTTGTFTHELSVLISALVHA